LNNNLTSLLDINHTKEQLTEAKIYYLIWLNCWLFERFLL